MMYMGLRTDTQSLHRLHLDLRSKEYKLRSNPSPITHFPIDYTLKLNFSLKVKKARQCRWLWKLFFLLLAVCIPPLRPFEWLHHFKCHFKPGIPFPGKPKLTTCWVNNSLTPDTDMPCQHVGCRSEFLADEEVALGCLLRAEPSWVWSREPKSTSVRQPCSRPQSDLRLASSTASLSTI